MQTLQEAVTTFINARAHDARNKNYEPFKDIPDSAFDVWDAITISEEKAYQRGFADALSLMAVIHANDLERR